MKTYDCIQCGKTTKWGHTKRNKFCGFDCQQEYNYRERVNLLLEGKAEWGIKNPPWVKRYIKELKGEHCEVCGLTEWLGNPITLELDHTDGNPKNNTVENLRLICPLCHSYTHSWKGKNRGNGRKERYKRPGSSVGRAAD
jgi:hypothetical protein